MITIADVIFVILITLIIGSTFYYGFRRTGPWGSFWTFLLIIFFGVLLANLWVTPVGPVYEGVAWLELIVVGLIFALLLAAASPDYPHRRRAVEVREEEAAGSALAVGAFFWFLIIFLLVAVIAGFLA